LKSNRLLPIVLVVLLLLVAACSVPSARDLPVISQWLAPTPTASPLSTATPTGVPGASVNPLSTHTTILAPTATGIPLSNPEPTSTGTVSAAIMDTRPSPFVYRAGDCPRRRITTMDRPHLRCGLEHCTPAVHPGDPAPERCALHLLPHGDHAAPGWRA
jgi:hypothetical protein